MSGTKRIFRHLPHFFRSEDAESLAYRFLSVFGGMLDAQDEDLLAMMRAHWVHTADNSGSKGFDTQQKGDLDKLLALFLEALGGTSLLRQIDRRAGAEGIEDDRIYRNRMLPLIQLLREGASTLEGIRSVIAANLGIFGASPEAVAARNSIKITEYLPSPVKHTFSVALGEVFHIKTPNQEAGPVVITIRTLQTNLTVFPMRGLEVEELATGRKMQWKKGTLYALAEHRLKISGTQVSYNEKPTTDGDVNFPYGPLLLPPGVSYWRIRTIVGEFGHSVGTDAIPPNEDVAAYQEEYPQRIFNNPLAIFAPSGPLFEVTFEYTKFQPATFMVSIPWVLPGGGNYSEVLDGLPDQPRLQIPYIVNRVKAAGVWAYVAYRMEFKEVMEPAEHFYFETEDLVKQDEQEMDDTLIFGGIFDATRYDQCVFQ